MFDYFDFIYFFGVKYLHSIFHLALCIFRDFREFSEFAVFNCLTEFLSAFKLFRPFEGFKWLSFDKPIKHYEKNILEAQVFFDGYSIICVFFGWKRKSYVIRFLGLQTN